VEYLIIAEPQRTRHAAIAPLQASVAHFVMYPEPDNISLDSSLLVTVTRDARRLYYGKVMLTLWPFL